MIETDKWYTLNQLKLDIKWKRYDKSTETDKYYIINYRMFDKLFKNCFKDAIKFTG